MKSTIGYVMQPHRSLHSNVFIMQIVINKKSIQGGVTLYAFNKYGEECCFISLPEQTCKPC